MSVDDAWLTAAGRALGGPAQITGRGPLTGGYVAADVERVDLDIAGHRVVVVVKAASAVEVAAMRARAVVRGIGPPRLLAVAGDRIVVTHAGVPLAEDEPVPPAVWETLGRVHAHWRGKRPRGVPVVDAAWWRALCDRTLVAVRGAAARTGDPTFDAAERALTAWRGDPRITGALAVLPRTLVHGDPHRGNVLVGPDGAALIDWGNALVAPAGLDLAVLRAQGATVPPGYGPPPGPLEQHGADLLAHVRYLGFACDHLGAKRVEDMLATASQALAALP